MALLFCFPFNTYYTRRPAGRPYRQSAFRPQAARCVTDPKYKTVFAVHKSYLYFTPFAPDCQALRAQLCNRPRSARRSGAAGKRRSRSRVPPCWCRRRGRTARPRRLLRLEHIFIPSAAPAAQKSRAVPPRGLTPCSGRAKMTGISLISEDETPCRSQQSS